MRMSTEDATCHVTVKYEKVYWQLKYSTRYGSWLGGNGGEYTCV